MIAATYSGQDIWLLNDPVNWAESFSGTFSLLRELQSSLSDREARRAFSGTLRTQLKFTCSRYGDPDYMKLIGGLRTANKQPVAVPFWPGEVAWSDRAGSPVGGGLKIAWKADWSQWEIFEGVEPVWPAAGDRWSPLLWGYISDDKAPEWTTDDKFDWAVEFTEAGPAEWALIPATEVWPQGPVPSGDYATAPDLWAQSINWTDKIRNTFHVSVPRQPIGFRRDQITTFYQHAVALQNERNTLFRATSDWAAALRFLTDHPASAFWVDAGISIARLTTDIGAADTMLTVSDTSALVAGDWIILGDGVHTATARVTGKTATTLTLDAALGRAFYHTATLSLLVLVRFLDLKVDLSWTTAAVASGTMHFREVPPEYTPAEDLGTVLGALPARVILFEFTDGFGAVSRYTNYERDLTYGGHAWSSQLIEHGDIKRSLNLEKDELQVTSGIWPSNPLLTYARLEAETTLALVVYHADLSAGIVSVGVTQFTGEITSCGIEGDKLTAQFTPGGDQGDELLPRWLVGAVCNHLGGTNTDGSFLISFGCQLLKAAWRFTGTVAAPVASTWPPTLHVTGLARTTGSAPAYTADFFAFGWIEWTPSGGTLQRRAIIGSTVPVSGALALSLDRWWTGLPTVGDAVVFFPGCDGQGPTCRTKYANYDNFGGNEYVPAGNPLLVKISTTAAGSKKS